MLDNRYDVGRTLGSGGMGEVFLARDRVLGRDVALKVLRTQYAGDNEFAERFRREARSAASLSHPNIVQVYDRGETDDGASYIAMEYVPGGTLKEKIVAEGPLGTKEAARLGAQVAEALEAAHERGMVHRDIKPQNVLLTDRGDAKVADFGIARAGSSVTISKTGSVMGTAGYMSPEQALGKPATPKSDLYSLGVVLYEALTGELPFTADNPIAVSMKHVNEPLVPPRELDPTIPQGMNALVTKLMAKNPEDRYASADKLADDLWRTSRGLQPTAAPTNVAQTNAATARMRRAPAAVPNPTPRVSPTRPTARPTPARRRRRFPLLMLLVVAVLLLLGALAIFQAVAGPNALRGWFDFLGGNDKPSATVRVPDVRGLPVPQARSRLTGAGLDVGRITRTSDNSVAAGRVIAPTRPVGTEVSRGSEVGLNVSTGPEVVPAASPSPTATAQSSPSPTAAASPAAPSAQPFQQQQSQGLQQPSGAGDAPTAESPNPAASAGAPADRGTVRGFGAPDDNSGPGNSNGDSGSGSDGSNSGPGSARGND